MITRIQRELVFRRALERFLRDYSSWSVWEVAGTQGISMGWGIVKRPGEISVRFIGCGNVAGESNLIPPLLPQVVGPIRYCSGTNQCSRCR